MDITDVAIRACRRNGADVALLPAARAGDSLDFLVATLTTDEGVEGNSFDVAGRHFRVAATGAVAVKDLFLGKDPLARKRLWQEYRLFDRALAPPVDRRTQRVRYACSDDPFDRARPPRPAARLDRISARSPWRANLAMD